MSTKVRLKTIMEKLDRAQKCSILGPQNLGSGHTTWILGLLRSLGKVLGEKRLLSDVLYLNQDHYSAPRTDRTSNCITVVLCWVYNDGKEGRVFVNIWKLRLKVRH